MMQFFLKTALQLVRLWLLSLLISNASSASVENKNKLEQYEKINWSKYTVAALKKKMPKNIYGQDVSLLPVQGLYFLPSGNLIEMNRAWEAKGNPWPEAIVLANGVYSLEKIEQLISDSRIFKKINAKTYISYRPIYVAPTAKLIINKNELRLSIIDGVFVLANGNVFIVDSVITSWDESAENYGVRKDIPKKELLFFGKQFPRPYLLIMNGSELYAGNSTFRGLGYKGSMGNFGLSMNYRVAQKNVFTTFNQLLRKLKKPTGWLIGNTFEHNFFGYFSNDAENVVILGNVYRDNVVYNIDPHDYSSNFLIARNLSYKAKHSHGIIISREVNNTVIAENLSLKNHGSGIMLDRNSDHNLIFNNVAMENQGDGIAIFESQNNEIINNVVVRNEHNGIFIRNSCDIKLQSNNIFRNAKSGTEIAVVNIDYLETRNFKLDPYSQSTSVSLLNNTFNNNLSAAISSKNKPGVRFKGNQFHNSGSTYFTGALQAFNREILATPRNKEFGYEGINSCR